MKKHGSNPIQDTRDGRRVPCGQEYIGSPGVLGNGWNLPEGYFAESTAVSFAFTDPAATAKALSDATKGMEFVKVKGGFMAGQALNPAQVKVLSELPPLPVMRAQLLGVLQAPAGKLVRTIAEPARSLASVFRAYSEKAQAAA